MDDLNDPFGDRVMKNVPPLARFPLKRDEIWHDGCKFPSIPPGNSHVLGPINSI